MCSTCKLTESKKCAKSEETKTYCTVAFQEWATCLAAAKLSARAVGWDNDPATVLESQRNAKLNRLTHRVHFEVKDALRAALPSANLIVANLYDSLLLHLLPRLEKHRRSGATLILSGILQGQETQILRASRKLGWKLQRRGRRGRWFCLQFFG